MNEYTPPNQADLVFFDLETSGLDPDRHDILEFAAVRVRADLSLEKGSVDCRCIMQRPDNAEPKALAVNGYSDAKWIDATHVRVALIEFASLLGGDKEAVLVGVNPSFDRSFVDATAKREGLRVPQSKYLIDVASIAWPLLVRGIVEKLGMETLCMRYGISNIGSHRAMTDVRRTIALYAKLLNMKVPNK